MNSAWAFPLIILADGKRISHFRGRELHGRALKVPEGHHGVLVEKKDALEAEPRQLDKPEQPTDLEAEDELPLGTLETEAKFDEMVIWGHESMAEAASDPYARGMEEWMQLSAQACYSLLLSFFLVVIMLTCIQIHSYDMEKV